MARINIEDSIKSDIRFINLAMKLGSVKLALGEITWAWMIAQKHFLTNQIDRSIPATEWAQQECNNAIVEVGLAKKTDNGILMSGSESQFAWLIQKKEAGEKSARDKKQRNQPKPKKNPENQRPLTPVERPLTPVNGAQPLSSFLSSPISLLNSQNSNSLILLSAEPNESVAAMSNDQDSISFKISNSKTVAISRDLVESWVDAYPKDFLSEEIKRARSWVLSNPHKAPKSNWTKFLNGWFSRTWDRHRQTLKSNPIKLTLEDLNEALGGL